jgi:hypothetical protein
MKVRRPITIDGAEALAIQALNFIAADSKHLDRFLSITGIEPIKIRAAASEPGFLTGVLEYLWADERLAMEFAAELAIDTTDIAPALIALRGAPWERESP